MEMTEPDFAVLSPDQVFPDREAVILLQLLPVSSPFPSLLDQEELVKAARFAHTRDRDRFIIRRSTLRKLLSLWTGSPAESLHYVKGQHGKPDIPGLPFRFNMSHTEGAIAYYFGPELAGIDIEDIQPTRRFAELEQTQLHPEEKSRCHSDLDFFSFWTRKEAVLKADGSGITDGLAELNTVVSPIDYKGSRYVVDTWKTGNKVISLAVRGTHRYQPRFLLL